MKFVRAVSTMSAATAAALLATVALAASPAWSQQRDEALLQTATAEQPAVLKTLERLVNIETGTGNAEGMAAMGAYLESELRAIGASVTRHKALEGVVGDNIVGRIRGKGRIAVGMDADIAIVDLDREWQITDDVVLSKIGWTPYAGRSVTGAIDRTLVRGRVVYEDGQVIIRQGELGTAMYIVRHGFVEVVREPEGLPNTISTTGAP